MTNVISKSFIAALSFLFVIAFSPVTQAAENPFGMSSDLNQQLQVADNTEGKCGEGKTKEKAEGKCGEGKDKEKAEGKCGEGKCGEGKSKEKAEGKCGGK